MWLWKLPWNHWILKQYQTQFHDFIMQSHKAALTEIAWTVYGTEPASTSSHNIALTLLEGNMWGIAFFQGSLENMTHLTVDYCWRKHTRRFADLVLRQFTRRWYHDVTIRILLKLPQSKTSEISFWLAPIHPEENLRFDTYVEEVGGKRQDMKGNNFEVRRQGSVPCLAQPFFVRQLQRSWETS